MTLKITRSTLLAFSRSTTSLPNGAKVATPSLTCWIPNGMPTMVKQSRMPPTI